MTETADVASPAGAEPGPNRTMGFTELKGWLRHRHPMVFLDRVLDYEPGDYLTSLMVVSGQTDAIAGHFPERGIFPASHLLQAVAQSAIILLQLSTSPLAEDEITLVGSVQARFGRIVVPGDQIVFRTTKESLDSRYFTFACRARVRDQHAATVRGTLARLHTSELGDQLW
ncbi:3-hydroxyacyl-ACP dehydratase FabZ family protein [Nocardia sp. BMG51109]|uniref:3-hydroxyacyl-ACP dehydratase FabZ family protein n=1 Tax=Nocardia sp. BMG51109 TaxID=1056816 RepID=UPI0004B180D9|nr:coronafacic acid dehydratase [Nocardia sp. BMG51109]